MLGIGILQNPMFGSGSPSTLARAFPDYGAGRVIVDACFGPGFSAWSDLALAATWFIVLTATVVVLLRRSLGKTPA